MLWHMEENCSTTYLRCLSLTPGKRLSAKKSPALPLLEKKHRIVELSWTWPWSARCTGRSKLYEHISDLVFPICAHAAQPDFCGCNLNKLGGKMYLYLLALYQLKQRLQTGCLGVCLCVCILVCLFDFLVFMCFPL